MKALAPTLLLSLLALAACDAVPPGADPGAPSATAAAGLLSDGPVEVLDAGHWSRVLGCSGMCVSEYSFWVDIAVRNDAYHKQVGILWTDSGWASVHTAWASYEEPLEGGYERWGVDVTIGQATSRPREVEFAVFATMGGVTSWDPYNNYHVYQSVSPAAPVRRLSSEVHYEPGTGGVMTGAVRVFDLAFEKRVTVRYTTDGWATYDDVAAEWSENEDWTFRVEGLGGDAASLPDEVRYAVRYDVDGASFWDNNGEQDYRHQLAPRFEAGHQWVDLDRPVSGILQLHGAFRTDLPIASIRGRVDEGAWQAGRIVTVETADLADGPHAVELEVTLEGGYTATGTIPFTVANRIQPLDTWVAPQLDGAGAPLLDPPSSGSAWGIGTDAAGRVYLLRDDVANTTRVVRHDAWGQTDGGFLFDAVAGPSRPRSIAVAPDGGVYGVVPWHDKALYRWRPDGSLDTGFGVDGRLDIGGAYDGEPFCNAGAAAVGPDHLFVLDTCNERVVRFTRDGLFRGAADMPAGDTSIPAALFWDADEGALRVLQARTLHRFESEVGQPLVRTASVTLADGFRFNSARGLVRADDGRFWAGNGVGSLVAFQADGTIDAEWWTTDTTDPLAGQFHLPQGVVVLADGSVAVLGAEGARVPRFSPDLR